MEHNRLRIIRSLVPLLAALAAVPTLLSSSANAAPHAQGATSGVLVFAGYRDGLSAIDTINANGSGRRQLTALQRSFAGEPAYSPDGSKIAYVCGNFELCVMNADGTAQGRLTTSPWPQKWDYVDHPTWSPDGTKIAFASNADGKFHVYMINADGTGLHKLAGTTLNDDDPSWSPDGTKIGFDRYRSWSGGTSAIYVMNADGTQPRRLSPGGVNGYGPSWAPDGSQVTFSAYEGDNAHLFIVNADGSDNHQLTHGLCEETDPTWTPDGSGLAFERNCADRLGIARGQFGGQIVRITAPRNGFDLYPEWQPKPTGGPPRRRSGRRRRRPVTPASRARTFTGERRSWGSTTCPTAVRASSAAPWLTIAPHSRTSRPLVRIPIGGSCSGATRPLASDSLPPRAASSSSTSGRPRTASAARRWPTSGPERSSNAAQRSGSLRPTTSPSFPTEPEPSPSLRDVAALSDARLRIWTEIRN